MTIIDFLAAARQAEGLSKRARAVLWGLIAFIDGRDGTAYPSVRALRRATGWERRAIQAGFAELARRGVVSVLGGERGGVGPGGRGITRRVRVNLDALRSMGAPDAPLKGARQAQEGRTPGAERAHARTRKGAPGAPKEDMKGTEKGRGEGALTPGGDWGLAEVLGTEVNHESD